MADGAIAACASIRSDYNQGNIYEDDFMDVWENRYHPHRHREWMRNGDCKDCKHFRYCQGNAMHLRDNEGKLLLCHLKRIAEK
jgi:radical SAM protein with 4Fe4S-binding SPASM domain